MASGWGGIPRELQRLLSLIGYGSTGGVCGRSLTDGKILFTGRQTCSSYLALWLCVSLTHVLIWLTKIVDYTLICNNILVHIEYDRQASFSFKCHLITQNIPLASKPLAFMLYCIEIAAIYFLIWYDMLNNWLLILWTQTRLV